MQGIGGEQDATHAEGPDQRLRRRDLVAFGDLLMSQDERRLAGERAEHLGGGPVVQVVEAALERLAVERDHPRSARRHPAAQPSGVPAKGGLQLGRVERQEQGAQRVDGRRPAQRGAEHRVQALAMHGDEHQDAAVGGGAREDGQHREQQQVGQRVAPSLAAARVGDPVQGGEQVGERHHGGSSTSVMPVNGARPPMIPRPSAAFTSRPCSEPNSPASPGNETMREPLTNTVESALSCFRAGAGSSRVLNSPTLRNNSPL